MLYLHSCNFLPSFYVELNAVKSAYTPTCNLCVTDTTFNVVRPIGLEAMFHCVKLPAFCGIRSGIVACFANSEFAKCTFSCIKLLLHNTD